MYNWRAIERKRTARWTLHSTARQSINSVGLLFTFTHTSNLHFTPIVKNISRCIARELAGLSEMHVVWPAAWCHMHGWWRHNGYWSKTQLNKWQLFISTRCVHAIRPRAECTNRWMLAKQPIAGRLLPSPLLSSLSLPLAPPSTYPLYLQDTAMHCQQRASDSRISIATRLTWSKFIINW